VNLAKALLPRPRQRLCSNRVSYLFHRGGRLQRAAICVAGLLALFLSACSSDPGDLQRAVDRLAADPELAHATVSFLVTHAGSGERLAALNPEAALPRASAQKLIVTAVALDLLGETNRPLTRLYASGPVTDGVLQGDLWIRGGGDMTLGSRHFNEEGRESAFLAAWVEAVRAAGIRSITGRVIADGSAFGYAGVPDDWNWSDLGNYYGAGPAGVSVFDNAIRFYFQTSSRTGEAAVLRRMFPVVPDLAFSHEVTGAATGTIDVTVYGAPFSPVRHVVGVLPLAQDAIEVSGSLPDPERQLALEFAAALGAGGVTVAGGPAARRTLGRMPAPDYEAGFRLLHTHPGPTVAEIVTVTNKKSINLFAEGLLCLIGYQRTGQGTTVAGLRELRAFLAQHLDVNGFSLTDGCGLSRSNAMNARNLCDLLNWMHRSPHFQTYFAALPEAGKSGTLASVCRGQPGEGRIFAKSGTMTRTKSFVGYVRPRSGQPLAFALTVVNYDCSNREMARKMQSVLNAMAVY
jgi:D-alanyl-D-alanine carboxypeptidase/D-alanyl-D-alanine-endopeptidase (penicillin-binding protein 4)